MDPPLFRQSLQPFVAGGVAGGFFAFAVEFLGGVVDLVSQTHDGSPYWAAPRRACRGRW